MKKRILIYSTALLLITGLSCSNHGQKKYQGNAENKVQQEHDGTITLKLDKAACYNDLSNPSGNTAEWNIIITNPGHFNVWISSATKDTTHLHYANSVKISFQDKLLEVDPACDKVVYNAAEVSSPFFRADSFIGSFYVSEPGEYNIQLISEKAIARNTGSPNNQSEDDTMLLSVNLTP